MLNQRRGRWADAAQMLYKCFVFGGALTTHQAGDTTDDIIHLLSLTSPEIIRRIKLSKHKKHLYKICKTSAQRLRRWSNIVQILYKVLCWLEKRSRRDCKSGGWLSNQDRSVRVIRA